MNTSQLSSQLRAAVAALHKGLRRQTNIASTYSMTEMETIGLLSRNPALLPTELATFTRVKTQSMSQILKKLEDHNVIKRTPSKDDKRKVYISLTAPGKKMVEKNWYERDEWLKKSIEAHLQQKEMDLLAKALPILQKLAEIK